MPSNLKNAIIATLTYADVFGYPLTSDEIFKYLIKIKNQKSKVKKIIQNSKLLGKKENLYFLYGKNHIVKIRKQREGWSRKKLKIARKVASYLKFIPMVKLVGITGALAMSNSKKDDDIDLMIITKKGFLWTTRFLVTLIVELLGTRRRPGDSGANNKICLNMFVDEEHLSVPVKERDLFSAHEVVQMKPIYERDKTYEKFLQANLWVEKYLPNSLEGKRQKAKGKNTIKNSKVYISFIENFLKKLQLWYMKNRRTKEVITNGIIRFHPEDARIWVIKGYKQKLRI